MSIKQKNMDVKQIESERCESGGKIKVFRNPLIYGYINVNASFFLMQLSYFLCHSESKFAFHPCCRAAGNGKQGSSLNALRREVLS